LGAVHKRCPQSGGRRGLSSADMEEGVLQVWISALFGAKNFGSFKNFGVSARTRGG